MPMPDKQRAQKQQRLGRLVDLQLQKQKKECVMQAEKIQQIQLQIKQVQQYIAEESAKLRGEIVGSQLHCITEYQGTLQRLLSELEALLSEEEKKIMVLQAEYYQVLQKQRVISKP